jgi:hypothetical protein
LTFVICQTLSKNCYGETGAAPRHCVFFNFRGSFHIWPDHPPPCPVVFSQTQSDWNHCRLKCKILCLAFISLPDRVFQGNHSIPGRLKSNKIASNELIYRNLLGIFHCGVNPQSSGKQRFLCYFSPVLPLSGLLLKQPLSHL